MAKGKSSGKSSGKSDSKQDKLMEALRAHVRARGSDYLKDPNITSVGVGLKNGDGPISLQFTVGEKLTAGIEALGSEPIPERITLADGTVVLTDVIERSYKPAFDLVEVETLGARRVRRDPIQPGISISHPNGTAGTIGLVVFDRATGAPCVLSNWHVLHGNAGEIGDKIVQPGPFDDNNTTGNESGKLLRSHLGDAGDCALARIEGRRFEREIFELGVTAARMARVALGDKVVKSGRTTGKTYGIVRRVEVMAKINYRPPAGVQSIGGFEIGIDPARAPGDGEISKGGDSGAAWMIANGAKATNVFAGLHFAGETDGNADEHALACYPLSVQKKLDFVLDPPAATATALAGEDLAVPRTGYNPDFLSAPLPLPSLPAEIRKDCVALDDKVAIPYTHFSVCLSKSRRMARLVAWNIDGSRLVVRPRRGFKLDPRIPSARQIGEEAYKNNKLDQGHIARRVDLVWGPLPEAEQANRDSSFFTNIAPQHERFNQSGRKGLWGRLENLILEQVDVQDVKVSAMGGPIFREEDVAHRGILIPAEFWKLVAYVGADGKFRVSAFILSQAEMLSDLELIDLDPFRLFQVTVSELADRTGFEFPDLDAADVMRNPALGVPVVEAESLRPDARAAREVRTLADMVI